MKVYFDSDADLDILEKKVITVIGYGSQGEAQSKNLRDSGLDVALGLRMGGGSWSKAKEDGFQVYTIEEAVRKGDIILVLVPDMIQPEIYEKLIAPNLGEGKVLDFAHGFNIHFGQITPPNNVDVIMVAPKSPGPRLRKTFQEGSGVPALIAVYQDYTGRAKTTALAISKALGNTRVGVLETTFKDETESDLIGEQTVLVGGLIELIKKGFEVLVETGYPSELAYFEACNEAKLIMDLIFEEGLVGMLEKVSVTARYGGLTIGPKVIDDSVKENMRKVVRNIQSGQFADDWIREHKSGEKNLKTLMKQVNDHEIEKVGRSLRNQMIKVRKGTN